MNDSIDQNVYEDLHARVNDGDDGLYGINHPLERLNSSRNQVVLGWDQAEPLLIHTDLRTCQLCGSKMRNEGGEKECKKKRCDKCGWSVMRNGFPALVKLDHAYPRRGTFKSDEIDPNTGEVIPGYTTQIGYMNQLAHKRSNKTPDVSVIVTEPENQHRLLGMGNIVDDNQLEHLDATQVYLISMHSVLVVIALALWIYRVFVRYPGQMSALQILCELCLVCYFPVCYIPIILVLMFAVSDTGKDVSFKGRQGRIVYGGSNSVIN